MNESVMTGQNRTRRSWVQSPVLAVCEFALIALIFWRDIHNHIFLSKTLYLFPLAWISLRVRGLRWKDIGLVRYLNWNKTLLVGVACGGAMELFELYISQPLLMRWTGKPPDLELFRALHGNIKWTLIAIAGSWTRTAAIHEARMDRRFDCQQLCIRRRASRSGYYGSIGERVRWACAGSHLSRMQTKSCRADHRAWHNRYTGCSTDVCGDVSDASVIVHRKKGSEPNAMSRKNHLPRLVISKPETVRLLS
jgi:hypothetical protein